MCKRSLRCPVCGRPRQQFFGSKLTTHAECSAPVAFQDELLVVREMFSPKLTDLRMASDLGVSIGVLNAWLKAAMRRRRARRLALEWGLDQAEAQHG